MNKLTKITLALALFTSLVVKAEEIAAIDPDPKQVQQESQLTEPSLENSAEMSDYQAAVEPKLDVEEQAQSADESILDQTVSTEAAPAELAAPADAAILPQS